MNPDQIAGAGLGVAILSLVATIAVGVLAWCISRRQLEATHLDQRREYIRQLDAVARVRERALLGEETASVREIERTLEVFDAVVPHPEFLKDLVDRDCELIATVAAADRAAFVDLVDEIRAINARRWLVDPTVTGPNMAHWGGRVRLTGEGTLGA